MKSIYRILSLAIILMTASQAFPQFMITGQGSYLKLLGGYDVKNIGFGGKIEYGINEKTVPYFGVNYYFPSKYYDVVECYALSSTTSPHSIDLTAEHNISFTQITIGVRRYLAGSTESMVGFYFLADMGYLLAPYQVKIVDEYEKGLYEVPYHGEKETLQNFIFDLGFGLDGNINIGSLFIETKICFPANQVNNQTVSVEIPSTWCTNAGIRFTLGSNGRGHHGRRRGW